MGGGKQHSEGRLGAILGTQIIHGGRIHSWHILGTDAEGRQKPWKGSDRGWDIARRQGSDGYGGTLRNLGGRQYVFRPRVL